jgi:CheY-like chemotaxis protein
VRALQVGGVAKGLKLELVIDPTIPPLLVGDAVRLRQVILNLVGNALKFTERGGVTVEARTAGREGDKHVVQFRVKDTGIGIPQDRLRAIFEPFVQADGSTTRKYGGTGLGLTISARLAEMMGSPLEVESEIGRGSCFHFAGTFAVAEQATVAVAAAPFVPVAGLHILLAEDNAINRVVAVRLLEKHGHTVTHACNGREALDRLATQDFDLVLMDVEMPVLDGLEAARRIRREESGGRRLPIIGLTAHAMQGDRERCLAAGMDGYVSKPIDPAKLYRELGEVMARGLLRLEGPEVPAATPTLAHGSVAL